MPTERDGPDRLQQGSRGRVRLDFDSPETESAWRRYSLETGRGNLRAGILLGGLTYFLFLVLDHYLVGDVLGAAAAVRATVLVLALGVLLFSRTRAGRDRFVPLAGAVGSLAGLGIVLIVMLSSSPGSSFYYVGLIPTMMWLFFISGVRWKASAAVVLLWIAAYFHVAVAVRGRPAPYAIADAFFLLSSMIFGTCASWMLEASRRRDFIQRATIDRERRRSDRLLLNVLPGEIARRLKSGEEGIVDRFERASVLFVDVVGFTPLAASTGPRELVGLLNDLFTGFDRVVEREGSVKIKTIGDGYMAVAGVPAPRPDHAAVMARTALGIRRAFRDCRAAEEAGVDIRMGIASGPLVAGIIGRDRFSYDLWGDTVNLASRLETTCTPGAIQVGPATSAMLKEEFVLESRGLVSLRGRGRVAACLLLSERPPAQHS